MDQDLSSHRTPLDGTTWSVWRDVELRSAGFPADMVLAICDEALARSADADGLAGAEDPADACGPAGTGDPPSDEVYAAAEKRLSAGIAGIAADPGFREAMTWQNPGLADLLHRSGPRPERRTKDRRRELVIASYLQRYSLKNDTIGFYGPEGWADATPGTAGLDVQPGEHLLAKQITYFEVWAIDKVAGAIARQGRLLGWLRPRRTRSVFLDGNVLHRPRGMAVVLTDAELAILDACDGSRTISEVLAGAGVPNGRALLTRLANLGALRLDLEGPMHTWPERLLRDQLEQIADPVARAEALAPVERMIEARDAVSAAAGDPARLKQELARLAGTFEQVTGSAATRRPGQTYAGRTLVYTDAVRDVRVRLGDAVTTALARPLGLVLDSARWLVNDVTAEYRKLFTRLLDRESARAHGAPVPLPRFITMATPYLFSPSSRTLTEIVANSVAELQRRWQGVLDTPACARRHAVRADEIAGRVAEAFPGHRVAWSCARQHSPDIMIAAASPDAVRHGDFLLVLGELHVANNTLEARSSVGQHPDPASLIAAERADHSARRIVIIPAKDSPLVTSRTAPPSALLSPDYAYWSASVIDSIDPPQPATVMAGAELLVIRRGDDLMVQSMSSGKELDFFEVIGDLMSGVVSSAFHPVAPMPHQPRITIDRLVLSREQWAIDVAESAWAFIKDERRRYYLARRWRMTLGLPERIFFRVPVEGKPMAVDFRSIILVNLFAKLVRQTKDAGFTEYIVTEMLPDLGQLWLHDSAGRRYSSELRFVAFDAINSVVQPADSAAATV